MLTLSRKIEEQVIIQAPDGNQIVIKVCQTQAD